MMVIIWATSLPKKNLSNGTNILKLTRLPSRSAAVSLIWA